MFIQSVLRWLRRKPEVRSCGRIDLLESRRLLSAGPALTGMRIVGSIHGATSIVISFNEGLNPTAAQIPQSYIFGRPVPSSSSDNGLTIGDILGFLAKPKPKAIKAGKIQWASATYNDANHTVTLSPYKAFNAAKFFRVLKVKGTGKYAVKDINGHALNGGVDTVIRWSYHTGKVLHFVDSDFDKATLTLKGPGQLFGFYRKVGNPDPTIFVSGTNAKSTLTGTVIQSRTGDGVINIAQLTGSSAKTNLLTSPHFAVQMG